MDAISVNSFKPGPFIQNTQPPGLANNTDAAVVSKVANVPLAHTDVKAISQDLKEVAENAMKDIQHFINSQERSVSVAKDEVSGHMVVKLLDPNTGEVIRTLPSEELLRIARSFEILGNKLVHQTA